VHQPILTLPTQTNKIITNTQQITLCEKLKTFNCNIRQFRD